MQITIKKLQAAEEFPIVIEPSTKVIEIKRHIALKCKLNISTQKLLYMGRALLDDHTISEYPQIKDGSKIHLLVIKVEGLESASRYFKEKGMSDERAKYLGKRLQEIAREKFSKLSLDDMERLAIDLLAYDYIHIIDPQMCDLSTKKLPK